VFIATDHSGAPLLQCLGQLRFLPFLGWWNETVCV